MPFISSSTGYERLHTLVISLGMEISDSILSALHHEVEACRQEQKEQLAVVGPILLGIDAVVRHIDEIRVLTDARALSLLDELVQAYRLITVEQFTVEQQGQQKSWVIASEALNKVLTWQHSCIQESLKKVPNTGTFAEAISPAKEEPPAFDMQQNLQGLLGAMRQEITATGMMAIRESAALLELVHVQKERIDSGPADAEKSSEETGERRSEEFSSVVQENISSLQEALHQEMGRLRHELVRE
ncbi:MAG: hypothetical protein D3917_01735 [Candidatus Electrothrix sp. AX5]|jgi:hypothetical protein|nr:hypothetical protein [Candidatus Electrothrix sp. AX5]